MVIPILPVRDLEEARDFRSRAGLEVQVYDEGYAFVLDDDGHECVHLAVRPEVDPPADLAACYVHVDDVQGWHGRLAQAGLPVTPVRDEPWGMEEFSVRDPSGNLIRIGRAR